MPLDIQFIALAPSEAERFEALETNLEQTRQAFIAKDKQIEALTTERDTALSEGRVKDAKLIEANKTIEDNQRVIAQHADTILRLQDQIKELTKPPVIPPTPPPVVVLPPTTPQKVTRTALGRWAGFTIEHSKKAPNATENAHARKAMDWGKSMGLDMFRLFLNRDETRTMAMLPADDPENITAYGRRIGLRWMADTMDTILGLLKTRGELKAYTDNLINLGCEGFYINDADRAAIPFEALKLMVGRLRDVAPEMPIFVSLLGSANVATFKAIVDYVEIQTFGTTGELTTFLKKDALPCVDLRKALTAADIKTRVDIILRNPPAAFFFYADLVTDYVDASDEEDQIVKEFVAAWKALAA